jgi:guanylate kinase
MLTDATSLSAVKKAVGSRLVLVYTEPPSPEELEKRHTKRGTPERIAVAAAETERDKNLLSGHSDVLKVSNQKEIEDLEKELK